MLRSQDRSARQHALSQAARIQGYESGRDAASEVRRSGASMLRAEVTQVLGNGKIRIRRETSVNPDGTLGDEDPFDYPIAAGGQPSVGDWVFGMESGGKPIFFGGAGAGVADTPKLFAATKTADQSITDRSVGGYQHVTWDSFTPVEGIFIDENDYITFSEPGAYICMLTKIAWAENYTGIRRARMLHNGAATVYATAFPAIDGVGWTTTTAGVEASGGDVLSLEVLQASGNPLSLDFAEITVFKISGPKGSKGDPGEKGDPGNPGSKGEPGSVGINWRNDANGALWSNTVNYLKDDGVRHSGSSWRALRPNVGVQPVEGLDWTYVAQKGDKGNPGDKGDSGSPDGNVSTIQLRRAEASLWTSSNPVLSVAEEGHETDTGKRKVGDGVKAWNGLPYFGGSGGEQVAKEPFQVYKAKGWASQTINRGSIGWGSTALGPEITVPILGQPPAGLQWAIDVVGGIRINPPNSSVSIFLSIGWDRVASTGVDGGGVLFANSQGALPVSGYKNSPPSLTREFTINFYMWVNTAGSYEIRPGPYPVARVYLAAI